MISIIAVCGPGSVVGIAPGYGLDGPGIESRWEKRFSTPVQTGPGAHPASCTMGTRSFPGVKNGRGVTLTLHPLLVPLVKKEYSYTSTPPMGCTACTEPQCLYRGALYLTVQLISALITILFLGLDYFGRVTVGRRLGQFLFHYF
jgi:hypothetical protein